MYVYICVGRKKRRNRDGVILDGRVELAGLFTRVRGVLSVQEGDGELQVLHSRAMPHCLQVHVQRQILPCPFQLIDPSINISHKHAYPFMHYIRPGISNLHVHFVRIEYCQLASTCTCAELYIYIDYSKCRTDFVIEQLICQTYFVFLQIGHQSNACPTNSFDC